MEELYYTASLPDSFGGVRGLKRRAHQRDSSVKDFLSKQDAYTLHKDIKRKFPRRKTIVLSVDDLWQTDLLDLSSLSRSNDNVRYLLTCVDVLSRFARVEMLRTKTANEVTAAFSRMIKDAKPNLLQSDKGTEFLNATFQALLRANGIKHYTSENDDIKASLVERWHRTIMAKLYRYFTYANTTRYVDIIQELVKSYNETPHSSIKIAPAERL